MVSAGCSSCCLPGVRLWRAVKARMRIEQPASRIHPYIPAAAPAALPRIPCSRAARIVSDEPVSLAAAAGTGLVPEERTSSTPTRSVVSITSLAHTAPPSAPAAHGGAGASSRRDEVTALVARSALVITDIPPGPHYSLRLAARVIASADVISTYSTSREDLDRAVKAVLTTSVLQDRTHDLAKTLFAQFRIVGATTVWERRSRRACLIFIKQDIHGIISFTAHTSLAGGSIGKMDVYCGNHPEMSIIVLNSTAKADFSGVGTALMQVAIETSLRNGYTNPLILQSLTGALAFYRKMGFMVERSGSRRASAVEEIERRIDEAIHTAPKGTEPNTIRAADTLSVPVVLRPSALAQWRDHVAEYPVLFC